MSNDVASAAVDLDIAADLELVAELRVALARNRFLVQQQPMLTVAKGATASMCSVGAHVLAADGRRLPTAAMARAASLAGMTADMDLWLIRTLIDGLRQDHPVLRRMDLVTAPVAAASLQTETFADDLNHLLATPDWPRSRLCLELSADLNELDAATVQRVVHVIRAHGCQCGLAGLGSSPHSLSLLKLLRADYAKIGDEFVRGVTHSSVDYEIVVGLARVAHALGTRTIGTGANDEATVAQLASAGVDIVQGAIVGEPRPLKVE